MHVPVHYNPYSIPRPLIHTCTHSNTHAHAYMHTLRHTHMHTHRLAEPAAVQTAALASLKKCCWLSGSVPLVLHTHTSSTHKHTHTKAAHTPAAPAAAQRAALAALVAYCLGNEAGGATCSCLGAWPGEREGRACPCS
jgi:hypothetical protein